MCQNTSSLSIRKFVVAFKKKTPKNKQMKPPKPTSMHWFLLKDARRTNSLLQNLVNTGKESNIFSIFPVYTVPQADRLVDKGKFLFTKYSSS